MDALGGWISQNKDWFVRDENNNIYDQAYFIQKIREAEEKAAQEKREAELREQRERELAAKNKVRDEIIALLPSLNAVSNYVRNSSYFTTTQKSTIIKELALAKRSSTLNGIFDYSFPY